MKNTDDIRSPGLPMRRREFLKRGVLTTSLMTFARWSPALLAAAPERTSANNRITVGLIGKGAMGSGHLQRLLSDREFQVLAVCEVDRERRELAKSIAEDTYAIERSRGTYHGCTAYEDYRDMLARPDLDAVVVATPDHWHTLQAIDAAKAGKDVYCEKPVSLTIQEGRRLVETVRRYGRVFQTGTQYRSIPTIRQVCQCVREGQLGRIKSVFTLLQTLGGWLGAARVKPYAQVVDAAICGQSYVPLDFPLPAEQVPAGLNWDLWVGPAPWRPYNCLYHTNPSPGVVPWAFCDAFGITSLTWHLAHSADVIQYALGMERSGPVEIFHPRDKKYPTLTCRYANGTLLHFVDHWGMVKDLYGAVPSSARLAGNFGGLFVGEKGWITSMSTGGPIEGGPEELLQSLPLKTREVNIGANDHHANWLDCIRTRKTTNCDEEIGHRSATLGHLTNIVFWTGQSLRWDPVREVFPNSPTANRLCARAMRAPWHL